MRHSGIGTDGQWLEAEFDAQEELADEHGFSVTLIARALRVGAGHSGAQATVVKSGVVRVMELQEQGWTYVRP
jgi:hypothetical protein